MKFFVAFCMILVAIVDLEIALGCRHCHNTHNTHHHHGRKRRSAAEFEGNLKKVQQVIADMDSEFKDKVSSQLDKLSGEGRTQFVDDLEKMAAAAEAAYLSVLADNDGNIPSNGELLNTVVARVNESYGDQEWYKRVDAFAGKDLAQLIQAKANALG